MNADKAIQLAIQSYQAGRSAEAERICGEILAERPKNADALHLLAIIAFRTGRLEQADALIRQAIAIEPARSDFHNNMGNILRGLGRVEEAIEAYRRSIACNSHVADTHNSLGLALHDVRQNDEAIGAFRESLRLGPKQAHVHNNLANSLREKGLLDEALASCQEALRLAPNSAEAYNNLGNILRDRKRFDEALKAYRKALQLAPGLAHFHYNLAGILRELGRTDEAIAAFEQAIRLDPQLAGAYYGLGNALCEKGLLAEGAVVYQRCIELKPQFYQAVNDLGVTLMDRGRIDEAISVYRRGLSAAPGVAETHFNLGLALLLKGDFKQGWPEYEWRLKCKQQESAGRQYSEPRWTGEPLDCRTILLHVEQGLGDTIQMVRYAKLVADRGGKVVLECQPELVELLTTAPGIDQVVAQNKALPKFDVQCPLLSLPHVFCTDLHSIPTAPYLRPNAALINEWFKRIGPRDGSLRIGLAWAGNPQFRGDHWRSLRLLQLAPFAGAAVTFYSLQKGSPATEAKAPPTGLNLIDLGPQLENFADTAAVVSLMDLVVTTDTSLPHLAGALGKPVWVMLQYVPHCTWLLAREDSPWYPTMRLFRQKRFGEWQEVIERVARELAELARQDF